MFWSSLPHQLPSLPRLPEPPLLGIGGPWEGGGGPSQPPPPLPIISAEAKNSRRMSRPPNTNKNRVGVLNTGAKA